MCVARTRRPFSELALGLLAVIAVASSLWRVAVVSRDQLAAPFDLISEGPHLTTVKAIRDGFNIYDPASYLDLPFFLTPYTPLYHVLVAQLPAHPSNPFFVGRIVALLFMLGSAASLFAVVRQRRYLPVALLALAVFFLMRPVTGNTAYLRSDAMALFFSVWAVIAAGKSGPRVREVVLPALLCATAIAAKQSFLAAGGACFVYFLLSRGARPALVFSLAAGLFASVFALAAWAYWGWGFWVAVTLPITDYPRDWESFFVHWHLMLGQPTFVFLIVLAAGLLLYVLVRTPSTLRDSPYFVYMALAWMMQTWVMTGIGAENHNLIEPILATLVWVTVVVQDRTTDLRLSWGRVVVLGALACCFAAELGLARRADYSYTTESATAQYVRARTETARALRALGIEHGQMLNLKNSQVTHDFEGHMNVNDPWMYITVVWQGRPITAERLIAAIQARYFDAVLVAPGLTSAANQGGDHPAQRIIRTVFQHYQLRVRGSEVNVLTPRAE